MGPDVIDEFKTFFDKREYWPLGSTKPLNANLSIILATNQDPKELVRNDIWSLDFYYRINNVVVRIPSLRFMKNDIPGIVSRIMDKFDNEFDATIKISSSAIEYLCSFDWRGNIRELENYLMPFYLDCKEENEEFINKEILVKKPPDCEIICNAPASDNLEEVMLKLMQNWKEGDKDIFNGHIFPIAAKVYREDFKPKMSYKEKESMAETITGLGGGGHRSKLWRMQMEYERITK
jgi:transcriptional regulator with PAS, ATPase and Fis domain